MTGLTISFRASPSTASSSRGRNVPRAAQLARLLPASARLVGAVTPVPTSFIQSCFGARQFGERGGHFGGAGNGRAFHARVVSRAAGAVMRQKPGILTHAVQAC